MPSAFFGIVTCRELAQAKGLGQDAVGFISKFERCKHRLCSEIVPGVTVQVAGTSVASFSSNGERRRSHLV